MDTAKLSQIIEAALLAAGRPLSTKDLIGLFGEQEQPQAKELDEALTGLEERYGDESPLELVKVSSGHRLQVRAEYSPWVSRLWEERTPRYSRAFMETLSIIAYRQPVTRGDIEDIRGVSVSSTIMRTLLDRRWVRAVGHRDVPGRPALYGTTREFLDYFGLSSLSELPELEELRDLDQINVELDFGGEGAANADAPAPGEMSSGEDVDAGTTPALATVTPIRPGALDEPPAEQPAGGDDSASPLGADADAPVASDPAEDVQAEEDGAEQPESLDQEPPANLQTDEQAGSTEAAAASADQHPEGESGDEMVSGSEDEELEGAGHGDADGGAADDEPKNPR